MVKPTSTQDLFSELNHGTLAVDVRTPAEFAGGYIPTAINLPLFSNVERSEIGLLYKTVGKIQAVAKGLEVAVPRVESFLHPFKAWGKKNLLIYCARGGMRSGTVSQLLQQRGFSARQLSGGYKEFRHLVLKRLKQLTPPCMLVLQGFTGVGKTRLLQLLDNHLDLEDLAQHRGSLFGGVGMQTHTQQQFEARLWLALEKLDLTQPVWVEAESSKIGPLLLPHTLHRGIRHSPQVWINAPMKIRIQRIVQDYGNLAANQPAAIETAMNSLKMLLGKKQLRQLCRWLQQGQLEMVAQVLLETYYDPCYRRSIGQRNWAMVVDSQDLYAAAQQLKALTQQYSQQVQIKNKPLAEFLKSSRSGCYNDTVQIPSLSI